MNVEVAGKFIQELCEERDKQDIRWGEQNHAPAVWLMILGEEVGEVNHAAQGLQFPKYYLGQDRIGWLEEYRKELVQVAAVAMAMVESLDRNELAGKEGK